MSKTIFVTGAAGFIGSHTAQALAARGDRVVGLDNLNDYYDPANKQANIREVQDALRRQGAAESFLFVEGDIRNADMLADIFSAHAFDGIVHLAAMAGVRSSLEQPHLYYDVNVTGTLNVLEAAVAAGGDGGGGDAADAERAALPAVVFASSSSVYGDTSRQPFKEDDHADRPLSPYAASKRAGELLGYTYHHLHGLAFTALRFFTVYGPRGRPDMMARKVLDHLCFGHDVPLYHAGHMRRDWTYVTDIVRGVLAAVDRPLGYEVVNLGTGDSVSVDAFIRRVETCAGRKTHLTPSPMMAADVAVTHADISKARTLLGYAPSVTVETGVEQFWDWYKHNVLNE